MTDGARPGSKAAAITLEAGADSAEACGSGSIDGATGGDAAGNAAAGGLCAAASPIELTFHPITPASRIDADASPAAHLRRRPPREGITATLAGPSRLVGRSADGSVTQMFPAVP